MPVILIDDGAGGVELAWYTPVGARPIEEAPVEERARAEAALSALAANRQYLALAPPTAAQVAQQVERLTRQTNALIRMTFGWLGDDTAGEVAVEVVPPGD